MDYIYSPSMRYTVILPFAISIISTELSVLDVSRFYPILDPLTLRARVAIMCHYISTHKCMSITFKIINNTSILTNIYLFYFAYYVFELIIKNHLFI